MLFMVIERFKDSDMIPVYRRLKEKGRMLPEGLKYIDSWIEPNFSRCFQVMECDDLRRLQEWILQWRGSGTSFEIVPVLSSAGAGGSEVIQQGENGWVVGEPDAIAIAEGLAALRETPAGGWAERVRPTVESFTYAAQAEGFTEIYRLLRG